MNSKVRKVIMFIGFSLMTLGIILDALTYNVLTVNFVFPLCAIFAICFTNTKNKNYINFGYCLAGIIGAFGLANFLTTDLYGCFITTIGYIVISISALIYFFSTVLDFCGFVKKGQGGDNDSNIVAVLNKYKELEKEEIITSEEFENLKSKSLQCTEGEKYSVEDLKQWKKLLDQQIINEDEFASIKNKIFKA